MSRREENRKSVRKGRRERVDSDSDDVVARSRYEMRPSRRQGDRRDRDIYDYSAYEDRYRGWQDLYRPGYRGDQYDYGRSYGSFNRGYDYDFYDNYRSSYYDYDAGGSGCRACNGNGRRGERVGYDPYIYRYEEEPRPRLRRSPESSRRPRRPPDGTREGPREAEHIGNRNDVNVFAMNNVSGQDGFKDKSSKKPKPVRAEVLGGDERDSRGRERERRRKPRTRRVEYDDDDDDDEGCAYDDKGCVYDNRRGRERR